MTNQDFRQEIKLKLVNDKGDHSTALEILKLSKENLPKKLYKYCSFNENNLNNLKNDILWASFPDEFNDPYDYHLTYDLVKKPSELFNEDFFDKINKEYQEHFFSKSDITKITSIAKNDETGQKSVRKIYEVVKKNLNIPGVDPKNLIEFILDLLGGGSSKLCKKGKDTTVICSLSEHITSIIMWSHYAQNHKGFVIEYDTHQIINEESSAIILPVIYDKDIYDISGMIYGDKNSSIAPTFMYGAACIKYDGWKYEQE